MIDSLDVSFLFFYINCAHVSVNSTPYFTWLFWGRGSLLLSYRCPVRVTRQFVDDLLKQNKIKTLKMVVLILFSLTIQLTLLTPGMLRKLPRIGTLRRKLMATGKNPLNSRMKPYVSMSIPISGKPNSTIKIPPKNAIDALTLCFWKKNRNVRSSPITQAKPQMKRIWRNQNSSYDERNVKKQVV